jgi:hypothetical protein
MLLSFNTLYNKLMDMSKTQTTRLNADLWRQRWRKARNGGNDIFHIYWRNPRTRHPDCRKLGLARWLIDEFLVLTGSEISDIIAYRDGFYSVEEMVRELAKLNNMTPVEVLKAEWAVIRWIWTDGPYKED